MTTQSYGQKLQDKPSRFGQLLATLANNEPSTKRQQAILRHVNSIPQVRKNLHNQSIREPWFSVVKYSFTQQVLTKVLDLSSSDGL